MGEGTAMEGTTVRGRRCVVREEDDAADRWGRSASERERARERAANSSRSTGAFSTTP